MRNLVEQLRLLELDDEESIGGRVANHKVSCRNVALRRDAIGARSPPSIQRKNVVARERLGRAKADIFVATASSRSAL